jgi:hypothetical protein
MWLKLRQCELIKAFHKVNDWQGAKRVVEAIKDTRKKNGRQPQIESLSGLKYA